MKKEEVIKHLLNTIITINELDNDLDDIRVFVFIDEFDNRIDIETTK